LRPAPRQPTPSYAQATEVCTQTGRAGLRDVVDLPAPTTPLPPHKAVALDSLQGYIPRPPLSRGLGLSKRRVDVVGLGLNATDIVLTVREVPPLGGKERIVSIDHQAGGQVATALVTCRRLGLQTCYIGKVGDDEAGRLQFASLRREKVDTRHTRIVRDTPNQVGYIIVDQKTGERTVYWDRHPRLTLRPGEVSADAIRGVRALHIDGCDVEAALKAARIARRAGIPVVADFDTVYRQVERLFPFVDHLIASSNFLPALTGEDDPFRVLAFMAKEYRPAAAGMTLGRDGALVHSQGKFVYSPGFVVETVDTTGAGDVFHGAYIYGLLAGWEMGRILDFSNAMAALNCTALGARGGIATQAAAEKLMASGTRHANRALADSLPALGAGASRPRIHSEW
jgi:sulfofructose kinase